MDIFDQNLEPLRTVWQFPASRQAFQMVIYKAIATTSDLPARNVESILAEIGNILEVEEAPKTRQDTAL